MGTPASFVVTADNVYWHVSDTPMLIRRAYGIGDEGHGVAVELVPPQKDRFDAPLREWLYRFNQAFIPAWYSQRRVEARCRRVLPEWAKARLVLPGQTRDCYDGDRLIVCGGRVNNVHQGGVVDAVLNGGVVGRVHAEGVVTCVYRGGVVRYVEEDGVVREVWDGGIVETVGDGIVQTVLKGGAVVEVLGWGVVLRNWGVVGNVHDCGTVAHVWTGGVVRTLTDRGLVRMHARVGEDIVKSQRAALILME